MAGQGSFSSSVCRLPDTREGMSLTNHRVAALPKPPDVPFCAAARMATAVVLARRSEVGRRGEIADSKCADICRHFQSLWSPGASIEPEKSHR